jgi:two-component system, NarL family, nitrate/nitrite response regulator NarL
MARTRFYREGLARYFGERCGFDVVGSAHDADSLAEIARRVPWQVALVDMSAHRAVEAVEALRADTRGGGVVAIAVREDEEEIIALAESGVSGFMANDASLDSLAEAVTSAARNEARCSDRVAAILARRVASLTAHVVREPAPVPLTRRQLEIVQLIDQGLPNKEIAQRLYIEVPTVKNHVHNILGRLNVQRRDQAAPAVRRISQGMIPSGEWR